MASEDMAMETPRGGNTLFLCELCSEGQTVKNQQMPIEGTLDHSCLTLVLSRSFQSHTPIITDNR